MAARRILILCEPGLLARGIATLLETDERLKVIGVTGDLPHARALIEQSKPDVLLVDEAQFPLQIGEVPGVAVLDCIPMIVVLRTGDNSVRICRIEERTLTSPEELIQAMIA